MNANEKINVNLASNPLRNRRLFILLMSLTGIVLVIISFLAIHLFISYRLKNNEVKASLNDMERMIKVAQGTDRELTVNIRRATEKHKGQVDLINGIILRKSFSWVKFFTDLEKSLPDSSYIVSLTPNFMSDSRVEVRFKVFSQNLDDLLKLINNLEAVKFNEIRVESETRDNRGLLLSEISLSYERSI